MQVYHLYGDAVEWSEIMRSSYTDNPKASVAGDAGVALFQEQDSVGGIN